MTAIARRLGAVVGAIGVGACLALVADAAGPAGACGLGASAGAGMLGVAARLSPGRAVLGAAVTGVAAVALDAIVQGVLGLGYPAWGALRASAGYSGGMAALATAVSAGMALRTSRAAAPCAPSRAASGASAGSG